MSDSHRRPVLIYLTDDERRQLQELANANSRSISGEGRAAVRAWIVRDQIRLHQRPA